MTTCHLLGLIFITIVNINTRNLVGMFTYCYRTHIINFKAIDSHLRYSIDVKMSRSRRGCDDLSLTWANIYNNCEYKHSKFGRNVYILLTNTYNPVSYTHLTLPTILLV